MSQNKKMVTSVKPVVGKLSGKIAAASAKTAIQYPFKSSSNVRAVRENSAAYTSRIRAIGNSKGVILNNQVLEAAGLESSAEVSIQAGKGVIYIVQVKKTGVNTDLSTWDKQFKTALKDGGKPEQDLFEGLENEFDTKEW